MVLSKANVHQFWNLAWERDRVRVKREHGLPRPWTIDPVLNSFRFCNVHREDDRVSKWLIENWFNPIQARVAFDDAVLFKAALVGRFVNHIPSLHELDDFVMSTDMDVFKGLAPLRKLPSPVFGSAYIIKSPNGVDKIHGVSQIIQPILDKVGPMLSGPGGMRWNTLEGTYDWLRQFPFMGPFMTYQVICDLAYTNFLAGASDELTWTCPGPGSTRGLGWVIDDDPEIYSYGSTRDHGLMIAIMRDLLDQVRELGDIGGRPWKLCTVQHWLCEYDKWRRGRAGENLKRRFGPCI